MKRFLHFSERLEAIAEKHPDFNEQIQNRDAEIFVSIPCLLLLMAIDKEDQNLCKLFCPKMFEEDSDLNKQFKELVDSHFTGKCIDQDFQLYNILEKTILEIEVSESEWRWIEDDAISVDQILQKIKILAIQLSWSKPTDWNQFMDVLLET